MNVATYIHFFEELLLIYLLVLNNKDTTNVFHEGQHQNVVLVFLQWVSEVWIIIIHIEKEQLHTFVLHTTEEIKIWKQEH